MKWTRRKFAAAVASAAVLAVAACGQSTETVTEPTPEVAADSAPVAAGEVNVYSSRHYDTDDILYERFTEETGIEVNLIEGDADELIERIKNEGANSPADILMTVDAGRLWRAEQEELFQSIESAVLESAVPENLQHPDNLWFGLTKRARVIVYNTEAVDPSELSTYEALAEPEWEGRVCIRSSNNIYNQSLLGSMVESKGLEATEAWAEGLVSNLARPPEGGDTDQIKAVAAGQCDVAIVNHYYWARMAKSDAPENQAATEATAVFFPNQEGRGTHVNISGAGVLVNAPNRENAIAFLEFLVTPEAQQIFAEGNNEYPVVEGVDIDPVVAELGDFKVDEVNVSAYGRNNPEVVKLVDRVGWK
ncbi:Fe(3+) ABC transporter substrate-binding protein [Halomicronema hongdechloris C2206]|uniref:Fe(3+) ABC transporter substrate-binding protein n=1 Tax=Halomicronema hongdechloris C2206 TaxID=1641165 RepID=A0A1Z3HU44_9CYAN|nr:Fe(3+) ABC transporter substrate-binding protein [Halomicronema hongdechloris]ASC73806.1 Fe(3+) ABC transporter substrate-binding protein [Halomicronema hongdechloris C2206]